MERGGNCTECATVDQGVGKCEAGSKWGAVQRWQRVGRLAK